MVHKILKDTMKHPPRWRWNACTCKQPSVAMGPTISVTVNPSSCASKTLPRHVMQKSRGKEEDCACCCCCHTMVANSETQVVIGSTCTHSVCCCALECKSVRQQLHLDESQFVVFRFSPSSRTTYLALLPMHQNIHETGRRVLVVTWFVADFPLGGRKGLLVLYQDSHGLAFL